MDDTDRKLLRLIEKNPRIHLRELAKRLGISTQAAHHRFQVLFEKWPLLNMSGCISGSYLGAVPIAIFGRSDAALAKEALDRLGESEFTRAAVASSGNQFFVVGELRDISELDGYTEFVRRAAKMPAPIVGIYCLDDGLCPSYPVHGVSKLKPDCRKLTLLDFRIVASLRDNARRPIADIADMVGASTKTVKQHLENMVSDGSLTLEVRGDPTQGGDVEALVHVGLRDGADKMEVGRRLLSKYPSHITYIRTFSNLPLFLLCIFYGNRLAEILRVLSEIGDDSDVVALMPNISCAYRVYETWRDKLPDIMIASANETRTHGSRSVLRAQ